MSTFRKLSAAETAAVLKLIRRGHTSLSAARARMLTVRFDHKENFTVAIVKSGKGVFTGVAKRNPSDKFNAEAGEALAFNRAIVETFPSGKPDPETREAIHRAVETVSKRRATRARTARA